MSHLVTVTPLLLSFEGLVARFHPPFFSPVLFDKEEKLRSPSTLFSSVALLFSSFVFSSDLHSSLRVGATAFSLKVTATFKKRSLVALADPPLFSLE